MNAQEYSLEELIRYARDCIEHNYGGSWHKETRQDVLSYVIGKLLENPKRHKGYVAAMVRNRFIDLSRRLEYKLRSPDHHLTQEGRVVVKDGVTELQVLHGYDDHSHLDCEVILNYLEPEDQELIRFRVNGYSLPEIAEETGRTVTSLKSRFCRMRNRLMERAPEFFEAYV